MTTETITVSEEAKEELWGHPKGLYICFATELWERFSFYGMKALLLLYLTKYHLFADGEGLDIMGAYAGLVYALPVIGGLIADKYLGMRKAVILGGIFLSLGHIAMAFEGHQAVQYAAGTILASDLTLADGTVLAAGTTLTEMVRVQDTAALNVFYLALALIVVGVGFLKPNISTIVGKLYAKDDPRRDSGFTIFYMGINTGSFIAAILCGWLGETYGWSYGFGAAGIGMIIGLFTFIWGQRYLEGHAEPSNPEILKEKVFGFLSKENAIYLGSVLSLVVVWFLIQSEPIVHATQNIFLIIAIVSIIFFAMFYHTDNPDKKVATFFAATAIIAGVLGVLLHIPADYLQRIMGEGAFSMIAGFYAYNEYSEVLVYIALASIFAFIVYGFLTHNSEEYGQTVVLMVLIVSTIVFWALFEQSYGSMTLFADRVLDRDLFGVEIKASMYTSLNALFIMVLAIPFAWLWVKLSQKGLEPSTPVKFGLGIFQVGLGFGALVLGAMFPNDSGKVAMIWLILAYLLHTTGELCLSPVGLSAVTKLSIGKVVGVSMGTWFLATALSETVATRLGKMAAIDTSGGSATATVAEQIATYTNLFSTLMWMGIGVGIFMIIISPLLKKGMHGVH